MTTTTRPAKLTTVERRALAYCQNIKAIGSATIVIEWKKSATWGRNPVISSHDGKCCSVSGCGYCKHSTALANVLCYLAETPEAHHTIARTAGAGVSSVASALLAIGWKLEFIAGTKNSDVHQISRVA